MKANLLNGRQRPIVGVHPAQRRIDQVHPLRSIHRLLKTQPELQRQFAMRASAVTREDKRISLGVRRLGVVDQVNLIAATGSRTEFQRIRILLCDPEPVPIGCGHAMCRIQENIGRRGAVLRLNRSAEKRSNAKHHKSHNGLQGQQLSGVSMNMMVGK